MMLSRLSLRARITIGSTVVAVLLLLAAAIAVYAQSTAIVEAKERAVLHGITEVYRGVIGEDPGEHFEKPGSKQHVAIVDAQGTVRMDTLPDGLKDRLDEIIALGPGLHDLSAGAATFYIYVDPIDTAQGTWNVVATRDMDIGDDVLSGVTRLLLVILAVGALVFALGSWFVSGAALRPVERLRRSAETLAVADRGDLLPVGPARDELNALAGTLNELLERMRASSDRERQMVSDASHELRNPLAVLQAQLALVDASDPALLADARATVARLSRVADALLQLSRLDAAGTRSTADPVALAAELTARIDRIRLRLSDQAPQVDLDFEVEAGGSAATASIGVDDFGRVVENLVDNAVGAAAGRPVHILVALRREGDDLVLSVADDAGGFDPGVADHAFERFVRGPSPAYSGGGLGLAIVARLSALAGGGASLDNRPGEGATVTLTLPLSPAD